MTDDFFKMTSFNYKPKRFIVQISFLLICFASSVFSTPAPDPNAEFTSPILWQPTNNIAVDGFTFKTHAAILVGPCSPLEKLWKLSKDRTKHSTQSQVARDLITCQYRYKSKVIGTIINNCETIDSLSWKIPNGGTSSDPHHREKRFIFLTGLVLGGLVTYGALTVYHNY
ncbi:MAG: hypothetical protein QWI73_06810, partial [Alphaproteobacteria bacterium]|nr:hypothetical protein [Alphaproteobacteria bacterium]